jgi:5-hydroxyisourate hydrolase
MSAITTHVLDTSRGKPASGVPIILEFKERGGNWAVLGKGETDADGRLRSLLPDAYHPAPGIYRLTFDTETYFSSLNLESFYPLVAVVFHLSETAEHYHVPLLLSPYGYSTYRGS